VAQRANWRFAMAGHGSELSRPTSASAMGGSMAIAERDITMAGGTSSRTVPRDITSLPRAISWLRGQGLLLETDVEVDPDLEITGIQKALDGSYPILFHNVKGYPHLQAVTNLFANYAVLEQ